jgi:uncharacterized protein VirK/YbjX
MSQNKTYSTKILLHTNNKLKNYINNQKIRKYISSELISIEYNQLKTVLPYNVGFVEHVTTNRETIPLHQERTKKMLPNNHPDFQLNLQKLYNSEKTTYIVMIQCNKDNVKVLSDMLSDIEDKKQIAIFPWLPITHKLTKTDRI